MTKDELIELQALPLDLKIQKSKLRIAEFVNHYGINGVYVSFSGGKDSTVLLDLVRQEFPEVLAVYCDMGLEFPEQKAFVRTFDNVKTIRPAKNFKQVITEYGYPIISKESAQNIYYARKALADGDEAKYRRYALGERINRKTGEKYKFAALSKLPMKLLESDIPISRECCYIMKKYPFKKFEKENDMHPFLGLLAEESQIRQQQYLKTGCNAFENKRPHSTPLGFWKEQDILRYIKENNLKIASPYGEVIEENGVLKCTGIERTGCCYCMFGVHLEKEPNRFQRLKKINPKIHEYCMKPLEEGGLGLKKILDFMEIPSE